MSQGLWLNLKIKSRKLCCKFGSFFMQEIITIHKQMIVLIRGLWQSIWPAEIVFHLVHLLKILVNCKGRVLDFIFVSYTPSDTYSFNRIVNLYLLVHLTKSIAYNIYVTSLKWETCKHARTDVNRRVSLLATHPSFHFAMGFNRAVNDANYLFGESVSLINFIKARAAFVYVFAPYSGWQTFLFPLLSLVHLCIALQ